MCIRDRLYIIRHWSRRKRKNCSSLRDVSLALGRPVGSRVSEQLKNFQLGKTNTSRLAEHAWDKQHRVQWDVAAILAKQSKIGQRKFKNLKYKNFKLQQPKLQELKCK